MSRVLHERARAQKLGHLGLDASLDRTVQLAFLACAVSYSLGERRARLKSSEGVLIVFDGRTIRGLPSSVDCLVRRSISGLRMIWRAQSQHGRLERTWARSVA